jgi:hypothetical protein
MSEINPSTSEPILNFSSPKAPPTILTIGALAWRLLAWWEGVDFILSIREEKIAMTLQLLLDWGWLALIVVGVVWFLGANKRPADTTSVHWGMVTAVAILAFMTGALITVHAVGTMPNVLIGWGGDAIAQNCSANVDTTRLVGLKEKNKVILICGAFDASRDAMEDERIAVSRPFTITGQTVSIVTPYGAMAEAVNDLSKQAGPTTIPNQAPAFMLWHTIAVIPTEVNISEIKHVSDIIKRGGRIVTQPQVGAFGSVQVILPTAPTTPPKT